MTDHIAEEEAKLAEFRARLAQREADLRLLMEALPE